MWINSTTIKLNLDQEVLDTFKKYAKIGGFLFVILGAIGIFFPTFMTLGTLIFVTYLMLFAGVSSATLTWMSNRKDWAGWLKSLLLIGVALYMIFYPMGGVATLGLLFSFYFFMDSFGSFGLGFSAQDTKHKWVWFLNAITSFILAIIFIIGWPFTSLWLVGFFVGVSLFFDGIALIVGGYAVDNLEEDTKEEDAKKEETTKKEE